MNGCATAGADRAQRQISERIESIRLAILAQQPEGIVRWATADWRLHAADGKSYTREAYLARTRELFARIERVDALRTSVDRIDVTGDTATVEITQAMERHEREAGTGRRLHLRLRYRERHTWVRVDGEWRVREVRFLGSPDRVELAQG